MATTALATPRCMRAAISGLSTPACKSASNASQKGRQYNRHS